MKKVATVFLFWSLFLVRSRLPMLTHSVLEVVAEAERLVLKLS
jgi:hypothetical protein